MYDASGILHFSDHELFLRDQEEDPRIAYVAVISIQNVDRTEITQVVRVKYSVLISGADGAISAECIIKEKELPPAHMRQRSWFTASVLDAIERQMVWPSDSWMGKDEIISTLSKEKGELTGLMVGITYVNVNEMKRVVKFPEMLQVYIHTQFINGG